jgi:sulfite reductase (ferredoxin)
MTERRWKDVLKGKMPDYLEQEIDIFDGQLQLRKQGKIEEKVFAETRLRRGVYGQRYDNGQRHDGIEQQALDFPERALMKGPDTLWHAPGMIRIKLPFGGLNPDQMDVLGELADEYSDGIIHVTTRQDVQLHYLHIEDAPDLMRRLASVNITSQEACGNSVRNVTGCPLAGVCHDEAFDTSPYAEALAYFLMGHDDTQDFGRKFKIAFSGCEAHACALVKMHDLGLLALRQEVDGELKNGFRIYVGGGLGTIPHQAKVLYDFVPEDKILPLAQGIARVYARHGEKKNRNRARIKFLVADLGVEEFRRLVDEELAVLPADERHTAYLETLDEHTYKPVRPAQALNGAARPEGFDEWYETNIYAQRQEGYSVVTVNLPLGDLTSRQIFRLADVARKYVGDNLRTTVEQNIVLRWVADADLPELYRELQSIGLATPGAGTIVDITSCPGTDTCKLGIASSRGLAGELRTRLTAKNATMPDAIKDLKVKVSGCFNSCGQHHVADIGFFGNARRVGNHRMPHFQVVLGGQWQENAGSFGLAVGAVPSKRIPDVLDAITERYVAERTPGETFQSWTSRLGKAAIKGLLEPYMDVPAFEIDPSFYTDWGDSRTYGIGDIGVGECAGEVVSVFSMEIAKAESKLLDGMIALDEEDYAEADERAYQAMLLAARSLLRTQVITVGNDADAVVQDFKALFFDKGLFSDRHGSTKFVQSFFKRHESGAEEVVDVDAAQHNVQEAQLFIEAVHAVEAKISGLVVS